VHIYLTGIAAAAAAAAATASLLLLLLPPFAAIGDPFSGPEKKAQTKHAY